MKCPVCELNCGEHFAVVDAKQYYRCENCQARFLNPSHFLSAKEEYAHYLHHENKVDDPQYRKFLNRLAKPLIEQLDPRQNGLDFGCGPGPALAALMREAGHEVALYDPYFFVNPDLLQRRYDFITCTETAEHFHDPAAQFHLLDRLLQPGGWLGVMTCFQDDDNAFANWHYRRDPTHVVFYRQDTFKWIAKRYGWHCKFPCKDVVLMQK